MPEENKAVVGGHVVYAANITDFIPDDGNLNEGTEFGGYVLRKSVGETGLHRGIVVDINDIVGIGNHTQETAIDLGFTKAIVVEVDDGHTLVVTKRKDFNLRDPNPNNLARRASILDNYSAQSGIRWDKDEFRRQAEKGLAVKDIFSEIDLSRIFPDGIPVSSEEDNTQDTQNRIIVQDVEEPLAEVLGRQYGTARGQAWQLGRHLIVCGDSLEEALVREVLAGRVPDFVWSDPPYGIDAVGGDGYVGGGAQYKIPFGGVSNGQRGAVQANAGHRYARVIGDDTTDTAVAAYGLFSRLAPRALHIWWGGNYYANALPPSRCWIVWDKETNGDFADAELAWCSDSSPVRIFKHAWNGLIKASERGEKRVHPTQKPVALAQWAFSKYGGYSDLVLDPFLGSGISVLAAESSGQSVIGFELSPDYIAVIIDRWSRLTGQTPVQV